MDNHNTANFFPPDTLVNGTPKPDRAFPSQSEEGKVNGTIRPRELIVMSNRVIKVNVGCGLDAYPGWQNLDNSPSIVLSRLPFGKKLFRTPPWPKEVIRHNCLKGLPYPDSSVRYIYSSHAFEHFSLRDSLAVARDCLRVLEVGGVLRIAVPDLKKIIDHYLASPDPMASHHMVQRLMLQSSIRGFLHPGSHHQQMFDARSLSQMLSDAGFRDIREKQFGESIIEEILSIEPKERAFETLYVEAVKHTQ